LAQVIPASFIHKHQLSRRRLLEVWQGGRADVT